MNIKFYSTSSENNRIGKTLYNETIVTGTFRDGVNLQNPIIQLETNVLNFNYCFIPDLNRYYFIDKIELTRKNLFTVYLKLDVLETYKNQIKGLTVVLSSSSTSNVYFDGFINGVDVRTDYDTYNFENNFDEDGQIILVATYGAERT